MDGRREILKAPGRRGDRIGLSRERDGRGEEIGAGRDGQMNGDGGGGREFCWRRRRKRPGVSAAPSRPVPPCRGRGDADRTVRLEPPRQRRAEYAETVTVRGILRRLSCLPRPRNPCPVPA